MWSSGMAAQFSSTKTRSCALAFGVHGAADEFFAGAGLAIDQDAAVGGGHQLDLLAEGLHGDGFAGDAGAEGELADELLVVDAELAGVDGVVQDDEGAVEGERLFEEVVGAELGGADGGFDGAVAGDDDDFGDMRGVHLANVGEGVEAVAVGQPDVEQDDVVDGVGEQGEGLGGGGGGGDGVALLGEDGFEGVADSGFVVDDQDMVHRSTTLIEGAEISDGDAGVGEGNLDDKARAGGGIGSRRGYFLDVPAQFLRRWKGRDPVPRRRVEKNGRNSRSRISSVMPWPVSAITISAMVWVSFVPVRIVSTRSSWTAWLPRRCR